MGKSQPSGGIRSAWSGSGYPAEPVKSRCCAKCKSPYGCAWGNCRCHEMTTEKQIADMNGEGR